MPWKEATVMSERSNFVEQAQQEEANISALCRTYGISRATGYKWLRRFIEEGIVGLQERSRRPRRSRDRITGIGEPEPARYERIAFEKDQVSPQGLPLASFVCPGHLLLYATIDLTFAFCDLSNIKHKAERAIC